MRGVMDRNRTPGVPRRPLTVGPGTPRLQTSPAFTNPPRRTRSGKSGLGTRSSRLAVNTVLPPVGDAWILLYVVSVPLTSRLSDTYTRGPSSLRAKPRTEFGPPA